MIGIFKSQVSRLCAEIDDKVQTFLNRLEVVLYPIRSGQNFTTDEDEVIRSRK